MKGTEILIVEDERVIAEEISHRLTNLGHEVLSIVSSGEEAVRKAGELHPDLVLMDIKLEGDMDGTEAAKQIRERFDIPVIYLTAFSDRKTLERAKVTEPFGYIVKPFEERDLKITIEMALSKHEKEKEHLVREIAERRMAEEQLSVAYEELKNIDEVKDSIIANVSHELRTPITIVSGAIELALDDNGEQVDRKLLEVARDALKRQDGIVEDLIQLSLASKKEFKLKKDDVNLHDLVETAVGRIKSPAGKKEIRIETDVPDVRLNVDPKAVEYVILKVIDNAVKFNQIGGSVKVSTKNSSESVEIIIEDSGIGISKEQCDKIFDRLHQLDPSSTRKFEGTGSGLAVAKNIVELHGGKIWVESEGIGKGSAFHIRLPIK